MRLVIALSLSTMSVFAIPAYADTIAAPSHVDHVTLYNWGATVSRTVQFDAPAGVHQIIVPDLPYGTTADSLRVVGSDSMIIGAVSLSTDRLPATTDVKSPEVIAAEAEIERLEAVLRDRDLAIATVRLRVDAANEQVGFLHNLALGTDPLTPDALTQLRALSQMVGTEVLAARQAALTAETEAQGLERDRVTDQDALDLATQALAALQTVGADYAALTLTVETTGGATHAATVTDAWGDAENPMDPAAVLAKYDRLTGWAGLDPATARAIRQAALALATGGALADLSDALARLPDPVR